MRMPLYTLYRATLRLLITPAYCCYFMIIKKIVKNNKNNSKGYCSYLCHTVCKTVESILQCALFFYIAISGVANAEERVDNNVVYSLKLPAQSVAQSLSDLSEQTDQMLLFSYDIAEGLKAKPVVGQYTIAQALDIMLAGTGFSGGLTTKGVLMISLTKSEVTDLKTEGIDKMNSKKKLLSTVISFFMGAVTAQGVVAENDMSSEDLSWALEEIVVTAQKREQNLMDVPIAISALSGSELSERGIDNIRDLSLAVPELTIFSGRPGSDIYLLRGIGDVDGDSLVGVYLDEAQVTGPTGVQLDLRTTDLERVEVLHGPQGTLYGQGSAGGTIRFITKDPNFDSLGGEMELSTASTEDGEPSHTLTGIVNLPILDDVFALRIASTYEDMGGWVDRQPGKNDINDSELYNLRIKALWRASENLDIKAMAVTHRNNVGFNDAPQTDNYIAILPDFALNIDLPSEDDYDLFNITVTYDLGFADLLSTSSYSDVQQEKRSASAISSFNIQRIAFEDVVFDALTQELRLVSSGVTQLQWSLGATYTENDQFAEVVVISDLSGAAIEILTDIEAQSWAVFGDINYQLTDQLTVGFGIRFFEEEKEIPGQSDTFDSIDPRLYLSYSLTEDIQIYSSIAEGFRSGGFNSLGLGFPESYDPETLRSFELGSKMSLLNNRLDAEVALFYSEYKDIQSQIITLSGLGYLDNIGEAEVKGVDLSLALAMTEQLTLKFSGNYIDTEFVDGPVGGELEVGDRLDYIPKYNYTLSAIYDVSWSVDVSGYIRLDYNEQGKSYDRLRTFGLEDESGVINLLNARVGADWGDIALELYANNLLNDNEQVFPTVTEDLMRLRPRTIGISASYSF